MMVEETITDPGRIASLLRAEIEGVTEPPFDSLSVEPSPGSETGTPAFTVLSADEEPLFTATHGPERLVLEFTGRPEAIASAADNAGLRARPKATTPPATVVFVERAAAVKRVIDVLRTTHESQ